LLRAKIAQKRRASAGFTLIELMLVVIIIGVIAAIAVPRMAGRTQRAKLVAAKADIASMVTSLDGFELDLGRYPTTEEGLGSLVAMPSTLTPEDGWKGPYMREIPRDPWGRPYVYKFPGEHGVDFDVASWGPDGQESTEDDIYNATKPAQGT
jgi:general secretion pathway protein G